MAAEDGWDLGRTPPRQGRVSRSGAGEVAKTGAGPAVAPLCDGGRASRGVTHSEGSRRGDGDRVATLRADVHVRVARRAPSTLCKPWLDGPHAARGAGGRLHFKVRGPRLPDGRKCPRGFRLGKPDRAQHRGLLTRRLSSRGRSWVWAAGASADCRAPRLLAGHGDYAYQPASYTEQSYDRSFEESTQHYYEGGKAAGPRVPGPTGAGRMEMGARRR